MSCEYQMVEPILRGLKAYLGGAAGTAKIAEVAARYTGDEALTMPDWTVTVGEPRLQGVAHLPHLYITPDRGRDDGMGLSAGPIDMVYQVQFAVLATANEEEAVNWLKLRYLVVLAELLQEMHTDPDYVGWEWGVGGPTEFYYLLTYTNQSNALVGDARLVTSIQMPN